MAEKPNKQEAIDIEFSIKKMVAESEISVNELIRLLNEKYQSSDSAPNITRQFKQGNMPHWKVCRIAETLGYELIFKKK